MGDGLLYDCGIGTQESNDAILIQFEIFFFGVQPSNEASSRDVDREMASRDTIKGR